MSSSSSPSGGIVIFTKTAAYRHESIPKGIETLRTLIASLDAGITVTATEDATELAETISHFQNVRSSAVVFLHTTGEVLTDAARDRIRAFVENGGAFVGIHSASGAEPQWQWYGDVLIGTRFKQHPPLQPGALHLHEPGHVCFEAFAKDLPLTGKVFGSEAKAPRWSVVDEWYNFHGRPGGEQTKVLAMADETSYQGGDMGENHPLIWTREIGENKARMFYTSLGHAEATYDDEQFRAHLRGGLAWATGREEKL